MIKDKQTNKLIPTSQFDDDTLDSFQPRDNNKTIHSQQGDFNQDSQQGDLTEDNQQGDLNEDNQGDLTEDNQQGDIVSRQGNLNKDSHQVNTDQEPSTSRKHLPKNKDKCNFENCIKPTEKILNWIQCSSCFIWLHYQCANLKTHPEPNEDFLCPKCRNILGYRKPLIR